MPEFGWQNNLALGRNYRLHIGKISSYFLDCQHSGAPFTTPVRTPFSPSTKDLSMNTMSRSWAVGTR